MSEQQVCTRCLLDTTVPTIRFDEQGVCNFCESHDRLLEHYRSKDPKAELGRIVETIKLTGKGKDYDCIVGVSGGTDSTYVLYIAKQLGLKPLAVHFDNGWNTDEAVTNIKNITSKLDVDLFTYVVDWEEFKDLQLSFLKASVPCVETPSDVGIHGALMKIANDEKVKYIVGGQSFITEGTVPRDWGYLDGTYIQTIQKKYGTCKLKSFPNLTLEKIFYLTFVKGIRQVPLLNYLDYSKAEAKIKLRDEFGWMDYGGHHYENIYSKFAFGWYLPHKFNIDKRKVSLSGPVRSGLMTREEALVLLSNKPEVMNELVEYCINKLGLTRKEFNDIYSRPPKSYRDYFTSESILKYFKPFIKLSVRANIFTPVLYEKYFA
jgi:N-acetyl sugar amidotransferase